ncbi:MAG: hypothetical protein HKP17_08730, partial [Ignavibacteriaceae bacterium]|nr:hypothetical protein [Ignavibacteriaceae bacterium]
MKSLLFSIVLIITASTIYSQTDYSDVLIENTIYSNAPEEIQQTKPFIR